MRICMTRLERRPEPSSAATRGYAAAAARRPRCATARATPTSTPERSPPGGQPHECATRCAPGKTATAASPPHTTGRAPTPAAAALKRSSDSMTATGRAPASSATCSAPGRPRARPPAPTQARVSDHLRRPIPCSAAAAGVRAAHDRSSRTHLGRLGRVLERADRLGADRFRAAPWWAPLAVAAHPGRFGSRNAGPQVFPGTGPILRDPPPPQDASARTHPVSSQRPPAPAQSADEGGQSAITGTRALGVPNRRRNRAAACERRPARRSRRTPRRARCESA